MIWDYTTFTWPHCNVILWYAVSAHAYEILASLPHEYDPTCRAMSTKYPLVSVLVPALDEVPCTYSWSINKSIVHNDPLCSRSRAGVGVTKPPFVRGFFFQFCKCRSKIFRITFIYHMCDRSYQTWTWYVIGKQCFDNTEKYKTQHNGVYWLIIPYSCSGWSIVPLLPSGGSVI